MERFVNVWPRETCGNPLVDSPLRGTYWKLVRLGETPVQVAENQREPHLVFARDELRVSGSGGCNRVTGGFELDGEKLKLGPMAGTMMACPAGMEQEQRFLQVAREGGAPPHQGQPPRDAGCGRRRDRAVRGGGAALSEAPPWR